MNESVKEVSSSNDILVEVTLANICHLLARKRGSFLLI